MIENGKVASFLSCDPATPPSRYRRSRRLDVAFLLRIRLETKD